MGRLAANVWCLAMAAALLSGPVAAEGPRFHDRSDRLGAMHRYTGGWEHFVGGGVAVLDCNADGYPDLFAAGGDTPARLFVNETAGAGAPLRFRAEATDLTGVTGAYPLDIDGDGWLDLAVLRVGENRLLKGGPDCRFAPADWGFEGGAAWSTAFSATFEPGFERPTLAIGNYVDRDDPEGPFGACDANTLHRPSGTRYGPPTRLEPGFCALSLLFSDWAGRGLADLRVSNDRHYYLRGGAEQMWRLDPLRLLGEADGFTAPSIWGMGIASRDITGDGRPEVVLTSMGDQLLLIATDGPGYRPAPYEIGTYAQRPFIGDDGRPSTGWHAAFGDVTNDGRADLFIAKGNVDQMPDMAMEDPNNLLIQGADGRFRERAAEAGVATTARARGAALADLNRDGWLDLVVVNRRAPMELWENAGGAGAWGGGAWLAITPRQAGPNRHAIGAWIALRTPDGRIDRQEVTVGGGHAGGVAGPVHFGLGSVEAAEIQITWPDGVASPWAPVAARQFLIAAREAGGLTLRPDAPAR